jgi:hypothetical protein
LSLPPALEAGKVGLERKPRKGKLGRSKTWAELETQSLKFSKVQASALFGGKNSITMTEDHVSSLFCCYSVCSMTIKLNSISQSDQLSWKTSMSHSIEI